MTDSKFLVVIADWDFDMPPDIEKAALEPIGARVVLEQCKTEDDVIAKCAGADGMLRQYAPISARVLDHLPKLRVISRYGTGMDLVDIPAAAERGVVACNVTNYALSEVSDQAMALLLACARQIVTLNDSVRAGVWDATGVGGAIERVDGQVLGLVGLGPIGQSVVPRARAFGLEVIAHSPRAPDEVFERLSVARVPFDQLLARSDFVSIHTPLRAETHHLISARELALMKPTAFLINTARGPIVDEAALVTALKDGQIAGAALDVVEHEPLAPDAPLRSAPNVIVTPHAGFYSKTSIETLRRETVAEVVRVLTGQPPRSPVTPDSPSA